MSTEPGAAAADHAATVGALYAAFARGDIPAVLGMLAEDVRWEDWADSFAQRADVPWLRARGGREGVAEFFGIVGGFDIGEFAVLSIMAGESQVAAEISIDAVVPGGGHYRDEELHLWSFDRTGKISRMRHYVDTAKHIAAAGGVDTTSRMTNESSTEG
ncbi:nuclear transport factor 2 family protein [Rhodococcus daqingensis]|uniref:Nuclear transport factor 2 family protein n=1 Tax=Rhodococcus daqingensis TaxID=2479363 RepID=A0ABW2RY69_9NOCA